MQYTAKELARIVKGTVEGDENTRVWKPCKIEEGEASQGMSFLDYMAAELEAEVTVDSYVQLSAYDAEKGVISFFMEDIHHTKTILDTQSGSLTYPSLSS